MKYSMVAAAIIGSVVAAQHKAHAGFHVRREAQAANDVCTVYTTVYETAPAPSVPAQSTVHVNTPPAVETSTTCTEEESIQTPPPAPGHPEEPSKDEGTPNYPANPPAHPETPKDTPEGGKPEYPATPAVPEGGKGTPEAGKPEYPAGTPEASTSCTDEAGVPSPTPVVPEGGKGTPEAGKPEYPAGTPEGGKPEYPATPAVPEGGKGTPTPEAGKPEYPAGTPEASTSCTDEAGVPSSTPVVPEGGKGTPEAGKPEYPAGTPEAGKPEYPASTPVVPEGGKGTPTPEAGKPGYPAGTPEAGKPEHPAETPEAGKPEYPAVPQSSAPADKPAPVPSTTKEAEKPVPTMSKDAEKPDHPTETPSAPSSSKVADKPKPTGSYNSGDHIVTNGDKWAITYTPYANSGDCKEKAEIQADIKKISELGFTTIRSYSTDCGVFENVVPECQKYGLKVIYGIFLEAGGKDGRGPFSDYANKQLKDITDNAPKDSVAMVIVGNECIFNNNCKADELASYIDHVRDELHSCGFPTDTAVTTTEPVGTWEEHGEALCSHIDVFACQVHPYFTQSVSAEEAGDFAAQQLEQAAAVCPEAAAKGRYITEIGWPSAGQSNGKAIAGKAEQKTAMKKIMEKVGSESCLFSFQNDGWKEPGNLDVEQNFGCVEAIN